MNSKWIKDLNVRPETIEILEGKKKKKLLDMGLGKDFFGYDLNHKQKIKKWDYIKLKISTAKETISKM